jgi:hypothetical protein
MSKSNWSRSASVFVLSLTWISAMGASECDSGGMGGDLSTAPTLVSAYPGSKGNDNKPRLRGRDAAPGSVVRIYADPACKGTLLGWGLAEQFNLPEAGEGTTPPPGVEVFVEDNTTTTFYAESAYLDDGNGKVVQSSPCSSAGLTYIEDSKAPGAPTLSGTAPTSRSRNPRPMINGTGEPLATVKIFTNATCSGNAVEGPINEMGRFSVSVDVNRGEETQLSAVVNDGANDDSPCSAPIAYVHDPSVGVELTQLSPTTSFRRGTQVQGQALAGSRVSIYDGAGCTGNLLGGPSPALAGPNDGSLVPFSVDVTVLRENAATRLYAKAEDQYGNSSCSSSYLSFVHDSVPPVIEKVEARVTGYDLAPSVTTFGEVGAEVRLYQSGDCRGPFQTGVVDIFRMGYVIGAPAPENGTAVYSSKLIDAAGNESPCSRPVTYTHDSIPPDAPTLTSVRGYDRQPTVDGFLATAGGGITLYISERVDARCSGSSRVAASEPFFYGETAFSIMLNSGAIRESGTYYISAIASDPAGNRSACTSRPLRYVY